MGAQENIRGVQDFMQATRDRDEARCSSLLAEDAVIRAAGVPRALGRVVEGREQILQNFRELGPPGQAEIRTIFADDTHVCAVQPVSSTFDGTQYFRGTGKPYTTYQCAVYRPEEAGSNSRRSTPTSSTFTSRPASSASIR